MAINGLNIGQYIISLLILFYFVSLGMLIIGFLWNRFSGDNRGNLKFFSDFLRSKEIDNINKFQAIMHLVVLYLLGPITLIFCNLYLAYYIISSVCEYIINKIFRITYNDYVEEYLKYVCTKLMISAAMLRYAPDK